MTDIPDIFATLPLREEALLKTAQDLTGLDDYGDMQFLTPFRVLLNALHDEARLNGVGHYGQAMRLVGSLSNRLRLVDALKRHSEILDEEIDVAAVIVGLPRTGSTMLHRLLAAAPQMTAMRWWEGLNPAPLPDEPRNEPAARIAIAQQAIDAMIAAAPDFNAIHAMEAEGYDEEILLLEHAFYSAVPEAALRVPSYSRWLEETDQTPGYEELVTMLKFLQWQNVNRRGKSWVLKTPHHLSAVEIVLKLFPQAKIIMTHRDPLETVPSFCSMVEAYSRPSTDQLDPHEIGQHWMRKLSYNLRHALKVRDKVGDEPFIDIFYKDALARPLECVEMIYERMGRPLTDNARTAMETWAADNAQNKHGHHTYDAETYGLTPDALAAEFAFYRDRFLSE